MTNQSEFSSFTNHIEKPVSRRAMLGLGVAIGAGLAFYGQPDAARASTIPFAPSQMPTALASWPSTLKVLQSTSGVVKTFEDAFVMTSISQVETIITSTGSVRLAVAVVGKSNQLQIINPFNGVLEKVVNIPDSQVLRGMVWNPKDRSVYFGITTGELYSYNYDTAKLTKLGKVAPKATSLYGLSVDSTGRVWGGSYPEGIIWNYKPSTNQFTQLPRLDTTSDYVRSMCITPDDIVYVGTGSVSPKVISFPASNPASKTTLSLPNLPATGFIFRLEARGDQILVSADGVATALIYNQKTKKTTVADKAKYSRLSVWSPKDSMYYWAISGNLYSTSSVTGVDTLLGSLNGLIPAHMWLEGNNLHMLSRSGALVTSTRFDLLTKTMTKQGTATLKGSGVGVHRLLAHSDGNLYIGGYQGQGIAKLNPTTGVKWQSLDTVPSNQIEGILEWNADRTFIGSYGSADLVRFLTKDADRGVSAFKLMERLKTNYEQSRPFALAKNSTRVFYGTVPEYGLSGGAFAIVNPVSDTVEAVYNKLIPGHSIVGLAANDKFVYGTTSVRNGLGKDNTPGVAKIFAFDLATKKVAWSKDITGHRAVTTPMIVDDKIIAATVEGIVVLRMTDGAVLNNHSFTGRLDKNYQPGWVNYGIGRIGSTYKFVHVAEDQVHVVDLSVGSVRKAESTSGVGVAFAVTSTGKLYVSYNDRSIAEISMEPTSPTIKSTADLVSVTSAGALVVRPSNGKGVWGDVKTLSTGWNYSTMKSIHVVDWQGRGVMDLLIQRTDGFLYLHEANGKGAYSLTGRKLNTSGWNSHTLSVGRISSTEDTLSIVSKSSDGILTAREVDKSTGDLKAPKQIGVGFTAYQIGLVPVDGKAYCDVVGQIGSELWYWPNQGGHKLGSRKQIRSSGWSGVTHISGVSEHYNTNVGIQYRLKSGEMCYVSARDGNIAGILASGILLPNDKVAGA